jgi:hypothetical protein
MITYLYLCPTHSEFEYAHSISTKLEFCPKCEEENIKTPVTRLIAKGSGFVLNGNCWAKDNYSK